MEEPQNGIQGKAECNLGAKNMARPTETEFFEPGPPCAAGFDPPIEATDPARGVNFAAVGEASTPGQLSVSFGHLPELKKAPKKLLMGD